MGICPVKLRDLKGICPITVIEWNTTNLIMFYTTSTFTTRKHHIKIKYKLFSELCTRKPFESTSGHKVSCLGGIGRAWWVFSRFTRLMLGNGSKICFWHDVWRAHQLKDAFLELFKIWPIVLKWGGSKSCQIKWWGKSDKGVIKVKSFYNLLCACDMFPLP